MNSAHSLNGYIGFYNRNKIEVKAATLSEAKKAVILHFKVPLSKWNQVAVELVEIAGKQYTTTITN